VSTVPRSETEERVVHVSGPRPTPRQLAREFRDVAVGVPLFATAPLLRHWHRRAGAGCALAGVIASCGGVEEALGFAGAYAVYVAQYRHPTTHLAGNHEPSCGAGILLALAMVTTTMARSAPVWGLPRGSTRIESLAAAWRCSAAVASWGICRR
jgi:hypothetical protein